MITCIPFVIQINNFSITPLSCDSSKVLLLLNVGQSGNIEPTTSLMPPLAITCCVI